MNGYHLSRINLLFPALLRGKFQRHIFTNPPVFGENMMLSYVWFPARWCPIVSQIGLYLQLGFKVDIWYIYFYSSYGLQTLQTNEVRSHGGHQTKRGLVAFTPPSHAFQDKRSWDHSPTSPKPASAPISWSWALVLKVPFCKTTSTGWTGDFSRILWWLKMAIEWKTL